ncbi:MAG: ubiquitin-like protein [Sulfurimonas sp.]|nr:ubiquitin-like protein [Sulfurimonas sp.]
MKLLTQILLVCLVLSANAYGMQLFVKTFTGNTIGLEVDPSDSIENVKGKILDKVSVAVGPFYILYNGITLEEGKTLDDYHVAKESILQIYTDITQDIFLNVTDGNTLTWSPPGGTTLPSWLSLSSDAVVATLAGVELILLLMVMIYKLHLRILLELLLIVVAMFMWQIIAIIE